jgi:hypothetical protein
LLLHVKDIAMTRGVPKCRFLTCPQPFSRIGDRIVRLQSLRHRIQQMNTPGIFVSVFSRR